MFLAVFLQDALGTVVRVLKKAEICERSVCLHLLIKPRCYTNLQEDPDFLLDGSLCRGALLAHVAVGHDAELQQHTTDLQVPGRYSSRQKPNTEMLPCRSSQIWSPSFLLF